MDIFNQQGDVLIQSVSEMPADGEKVNPKDRGFVLAEGEHTGHAHVIDKLADLEMIEKDGFFYIKTDKDQPITHEEHHPNKLFPGINKIMIVREYDHFAEEARRVQD